MFLIDTSIFVSLFRKNKDIMDFLKKIGKDLYISVATLAELRFGFYYKKTSQNIYRESSFSALIKEKMIRTLPFDDKIADKYAQIQAYLTFERMPLSVFDGVIAATALVYNATLVTIDDDFKRVKGLKLVFPKPKSS